MRVVEADPEVCFEMLLADRVDLAVVVTTDVLPPTNDPRFEQAPLLDDSLDLAVPPDHRLAHRSWVSLTELAGDPWIMDRPGRPYHHLVMTACASAGFTPDQVHEIVEWETGAAFARHGFGVMLVPRLAPIAALHGLVRIPLRGVATPARRVRTSVRAGTADRPEIALALRELRRVADEVQAQGAEH